jgi:hypothetical protein
LLCAIPSFVVQLGWLICQPFFVWRWTPIEDVGPVSHADRILAKMRQNPRDWRIDDLYTVARSFAVEWRQHGTSHVTFRHPSGSKLTIPAHRSIKSVYIKKFVRLIETGIGD